MAEVTKYETKENDRWDNVAYAAYGDPFKIPEITGVNPYVPLNVVLAGGINLNVPIQESTVVKTSLLPPWKK